jgi:hypothetical protein
VGLLVVVLVGLLTACSSDGSSDDEDANGNRDAADEPAAEVPGADVARPAVTGPITAGTQDEPFLAMPAQVGEQAGYVEDEYFVEGEATAYEPDGELGQDGRWSVTPAGTAPYRTRMLVRRPEDPDDFNGTVLVEWFNVTGGFDADPEFIFAHDELLRSGFAWIGVSAQHVGVEGGGGAFSVPGAEAVGALTAWDPERYGELNHPGDPYSYDMFSQAAQAIRRPGDVDLLGGLEVQHVLAAGESQSAARMVTYIDAVHPIARIYDGFLVHSRGGGSAPLDETGAVIGEGAVHIRDDLDVPVLQFETETDMFGPLGFHAAEQPDTDLLRTWEVAGTSHIDRSTIDYGIDTGADFTGGGAIGVVNQCGSINDGPQHYVLQAAISALRTWVVDGDAPAEAPRFEVTDSGDAIARDERGIALSGIRTPAVDVPTSVETGEVPAGRSGLCVLFGDSRPFDAATLAELYPTHQDYVDAVSESADATVSAGYLLPEDADAFVAEAEDAPVPE